MNFKGHITGGAITGAAVTAGAFILSKNYGSSLSLIELAQVFGVALFFSLFPDLDISSIPQRWFYRVVFVGLLYFGYRGQYELATLLGIIAITPVLDHHRGWTHNIFAALIVPIILAGIYEYILMKNQFFYTQSPDHVFEHLQEHLWLVVACILGWYTHLLLDSRLPLFKNSKGHH